MSVGDQQSLCCEAPLLLHCKVTAAPSAGRKTVKENKVKSLSEVGRKMCLEFVLFCDWDKNTNVPENVRPRWWEQVLYISTIFQLQITNMEREKFTEASSSHPIHNSDHETYKQPFSFLPPFPSVDPMDN